MTLRGTNGRSPGLEFDTGPVAAALAVERQRENGLIEFNFAGFENAAQQRRSGKPHRKALGPDERLSRLARNVGDAHFFKSDVRYRQQLEVDRAADTDFAAEHLRGFFLEHPAIAVPIDEIGHGKERCKDNDKKAAKI